MMNYLDPTDPLGYYYYGPQPGDDFNEEDAFRRALRALATIFIAVIILMAVSALTSCTTPQPVIVERTTHDTVRITQLQRDSIFRHDSIYVREHTEGDTVYLEVNRWHTQYRDRWHHDSIYLSRRDSVPVPYPVEKQVPAPLSWLQQMQLWLGRLVLVALALCAAVWLFRKRTFWLRLIK